VSSSEAGGVGRIFEELDRGAAQMRAEAAIGAERYAELIREWADEAIRERAAELVALRDEIAERPGELDAKTGRLHRALVATAEALQRAA
jgi:hypothetical protein